MSFALLWTLARVAIVESPDEVQPEDLHSDSGGAFSDSFGPELQGRESELPPLALLRSWVRPQCVATAVARLPQAVAAKEHIPSFPGVFVFE